MSKYTKEIEKRRTFAIISHPDAGKTTLTEKFLLYGGAINLAGSVKGKATARHAVSDWMEIEKERGISVTSSVLQFHYDGYCINILDTPGRLSSSNPNLQNIPIRDENGKEIRKAFIPDEGCLFFSADYSQIELRIMAHLSEDKNMIDAFLSGYDIHAATAAKVYKTNIEDVNSDMRRKAKTANFGIIYGISVFGLAERMNVDRKEAKELIEGYFETYPQEKA